MTFPDDAEGTFLGTQGRQIYWRSWPAAGEPRAVVVIAHGFGDHSGRYERLAQRLVADGYEVYALDHHGHGRSAGRRGQFSMQAAVDDLHQLVLRAGSRHPQTDTILLGHSMGGAITLRYAMEHGDRLAGVILSGTLAQVDGHAAAKSVGRLVGSVAPRLPVAKIDSRLISRDPAVVAAYDFDPLTFPTIPAGTAAEFLRHVKTLPADLSRITGPALVMWGTADGLCAPAGSEMIASRLGSADVTAVPFEGLYHEILNEPEREQVIAQLLDWLGARVPAAHVHD
jgi:alpha-beta hydrolase superfamily lysophospholipase